jgi:periplasmic divalent cation tolerance protein
MKKYCVLFCTCPDNNTAEKISRALVSEKLAACVQILPSISSCYWWEGKIETASEVLMIIKTLPGHFRKVEKCILGLHPYKIPEIIALPVIQGHSSYLKWIKDSVLHAEKK